MKNYLPVFLLSLLVTSAFAQKITIKKDTISVNGSKLLLMQTASQQPLKYIVSALDGRQLLTIHYSRLEKKGDPSYIITFTHDGKQALTTKHRKDPEAFIREILNYKLVKNNLVDEQAEAAFIKTHSFPDGYTDLDKLIEY